jgi:histidyl-tRNA synthetase
MRDFLPQDVRRREYVIAIVEETYRRYGFQPLETPALENIETLTGKYGEEGNKLIFKVLRRGEHESSGETDLALRYDLTVPLARVVAEHRGKLPRFFKRYQIQPVWRADRPARGRFREFYQCDVDAIGSRSMVVEAELCSAVADVLQRLGFRDFTIRINHRQLLAGLLEAAGVGPDLHGQALIALDKMDKIDADGVLRELQERGITDGQRVLAAFAADATVQKVRELVSDRPEAQAP